jgi:glycosyltransferase involved in cell wall biosynthesis
MDQDILDHAKWRGRVVENWPAGVWRRILRVQIAARLRFFRAVSKLSLRSPIAELAYSRYILEQLWIAIRIRADLYIGHNPQSLPVVAWAARLTGAKYGFDFEDFHQGETRLNEAGSLSSQLLSAIEARHVHGAQHVTAASWGIANEVAALHDIAKPITILNVFKWADRAKLLSAKKIASRSPELSLYWFSQIVSLDRGIQDVIQAMGRVREPIVLHIRGLLNPDVQAQLMLLAQTSGVKNQLTFHGLVPPDELLATAVEHDVGLCLETPAVLNREICITNKMFLYLLAGLAVVASRTRGQSEVLAKCPEAGFLYDSGNIEQLAFIIERLARDPGLLAKAKASALTAARDCWNWEHESRTLVASIDRLLKATSFVNRREVVGASEHDPSQRTAPDGEAPSGSE